MSKRLFLFLSWSLPAIVVFAGFALNPPVNGILWAACFLVMAFGRFVAARKEGQTPAYFSGSWYLLCALLSLPYAYGIISAWGLDSGDAAVAASLLARFCNSP